jgi:hypothetical protein
MYELKKIGKVFTSKFVGTGPSSYKKRIYRAAVSQRLRNAALDSTTSTNFRFWSNSYSWRTITFCFSSAGVSKILPNWGHRSSGMLHGKLCSWPPTFRGNPSGPVLKRQAFINNHELLDLCRWTGVLKHQQPITNLRRVTSQKNKSRNYTTAEAAAKLSGCLAPTHHSPFGRKLK